jgi:hypothetical protein
MGNHPILLESLAEFHISICEKGAQLYMVTAVDCQVPAVGLVAMLTEEPTIPTKFKIWWMCFWWKWPGALLSTVCKISLWNSRMAGSHPRV